MDTVRSMIDNLEVSIKKVIVGNDETIDRLIEMFICGGHVLDEDEPGTGKTLLMESLAVASDLEYSWTQGTPDLRPSDLAGVSVWRPDTQKFEYMPGTLNASINVFDEINRASPKTQSATLEAMQKGVITVDGVAHQMPTPFMVLATQNPLEHDGTYPLPKAQVDRFPIRLTMQKLSVVEEATVYDRTEIGEPVAKPVTGFDIQVVRKAYEQIDVDPRMRAYVANLMAAARNPESVGLETPYRLGASTRPGTWLIRMSKAAAFKLGKRYVTDQLMQERLYDVLNHRLRKGHKSPLSGEILDDVRDNYIPALIEAVPVPGVSENELEDLAHQRNN